MDTPADKTKRRQYLDDVIDAADQAPAPAPAPKKPKKKLRERAGMGGLDNLERVEKSMSRLAKANQDLKTAKSPVVRALLEQVRDNETRLQRRLRRQ